MTASLFRILFGTLVIGCAASRSSAATFGHFTYEATDVITITDYPESEGGEVVVPATIAGKPVTKIGPWAFGNCAEITRITLPSGIVEIAENAFYRCSALGAINLPAGLTRLGQHSFDECIALQSIVLPDTLDTVEQFTFRSCTALASVILPDTLSSIGDDAFQGCSSLEAISLPSTITTIGRSSFSYCTGLTAIAIPNRTTSIGGGAFHGCANLASVTIPNSVTSIDSNAFTDCTALTHIDLPDSITTLGIAVFANTGLASVTLPRHITSVPWFTFNGCVNLTSVRVPASVATVVSQAFSYCPNLAEVWFEGDAPALMYQSFFDGSEQATVYRLPGTTGWGSTYATRPVVLWGPPAISTHPSSVAADVGDAVTFKVISQANGAPPASYQWYWNNLPLPNATASTFTLAHVHEADAGNYKVTVSNAAGSVTSNSAALTVTGEPTYTQQQYEAALGAGFTLGVGTVTGNPNSYGLYTLGQFQTLDLRTPLLAKEPGSGMFKLVIAAQKSTDLHGFADLDFSDGEITINPAGALEFRFQSDDDAALFRLKTK